MSEASERLDLSMDADTEAEVECPWCGDTVTIALDPSGGAVQEYVQDCEVCCQPLLVDLRYLRSGAAEVSLERAD